MRELPLLAPQWLHPDPRGRGSNSPLPEFNHGSPHSQLQGEVEIPKHENQQSTGLVHDRGRGYTYRSKLCRACTPVPNSGWSSAGSEPTKRTLPDEHLGVTIPPCIRVSLRSPAEDHPGTVNMPPCGHTGSAQKGRDFTLYPLTNTLYPASRYGIALARVETALSPLSARWCVRKSRVTKRPTRFQTGESSYPPSHHKNPNTCAPKTVYPP